MKHLKSFNEAWYNDLYKWATTPLKVDVGVPELPTEETFQMSDENLTTLIKCIEKLFQVIKRKLLKNQIINATDVLHDQIELISKCLLEDRLTKEQKIRMADSVYSLCSHIVAVCRQETILSRRFLDPLNELLELSNNYSKINELFGWSKKEKAEKNRLYWQKKKEEDEEKYLKRKEQLQKSYPDYSNVGEDEEYITYGDCKKCGKRSVIIRHHDEEGCDFKGKTQSEKWMR